MNKDIYRNIAAVTAIFIISLSVMLITNYFQVRGVTPLQTEVVETLKLLNDTNPDNPELQEQIRQLDLLARRAYFIQADHLKIEGRLAHHRDAIQIDASGSFEVGCLYLIGHGSRVRCLLAFLF